MLKGIQSLYLELTRSTILMNTFHISGKLVLKMNIKKAVNLSTWLYKRSLVCGTIRGCELAEYAHIITVVRNPVEFSDTDTFWNSLKNVLKELRVSLGNPSMTIAKQQIEYYYFK